MTEGPKKHRAGKKLRTTRVDGLSNDLLVILLFKKVTLKNRFFKVPKSFRFFCLSSQVAPYFVSDFRVKHPGAQQGYSRLAIVQASIYYSIVRIPRVLILYG